MARRLSVRSFRASFTSLEEPVEVLNRTETIGTWVPVGVDPVEAFPGLQPRPVPTSGVGSAWTTTRTEEPVRAVPKRGGKSK